MKRLLIVAGLCALALPTARAQVFEVTGGSSTLFESQGAGVTTYLPKQTIYTGLGFTHDGVHFGVSDTFEFHHWNTTVGDRSFSFQGLTLYERGVSIEKQSTTQELVLFTGATGTGFAAPYFRSFGLQSAGAGVYWKRKFEHGYFSSLEATDGHKRTTLQSGEWEWRTVRFTGTGGLLSNTAYVNGQVTYRPAKWFLLTGGHNDVFLPEHARYNSGQVGLLVGRFDGYASAFTSKLGIADAVGGGVRLGSASVRANFYQAPHQRSIVTVSGNEQWNHFAVNATWSHTGSNSTIGVGGGYTGNRISVRLDHTVLLNLLTGQFQRTTVATVGVRIGNVSATLSGLFDHKHVKYTADGTGFAYGHWVSAETEQQHAPVKAGKFIVQGTVVDDQGNPVEGAAVQVGTQTVYTNAQGAFMARVKQPGRVKVQALPTAFATPGLWETVSGPDTASPDEPATLVMRRVSLQHTVGK